MNDLKTRQPGKKPARLRVHQLAHDICTICHRNPEGTYKAQADRENALMLCAVQLFSHHIRCKRVVNLTAYDIDLLVTDWQNAQLNAATIRNRLVYLRWLARKIGKPQIVRSNRAYGVGRSASCAP